LRLASGILEAFLTKFYI
jgi:hypothetical protein